MKLDQEPHKPTTPEELAHMEDIDTLITVDGKGKFAKWEALQRILLRIRLERDSK